MSLLLTLTRAAAKSTAAKLRRFGVGDMHPQWTERAEICEKCPLRTIHRGVTYCGNPLFKQVQRDVVEDGCGCPTRSKAQDPAEHCPLDSRFHQAETVAGQCTCKWCAGLH